MAYSSKSQSHRSRKLLIFGAVLLVAAGVLATLELTNTTHLLHHAKPISASPTTKGIINSRAAQTASNPPPSSSGQDKTNGSAATANTLLANPTGNFVSNHHPNLSGSPAPNLIASSCTTTPGATCQITFTKAGVTKSLPAETTDAGGSAFWSWKLQDYGLTEGTWKIQALVKLGDQTKTASDAQDLVVAQ